MENNPVQTTLYGVGACSLGLLVLIAALIWHATLERSTASAGSTNSAGGVISGILAFVGLICLLYGISLLVVAWLRKKSEHNGTTNADIPTNITTSQPDPSLQLPHDEAVTDLPPAGDSLPKDHNSADPNNS